MYVIKYVFWKEEMLNGRAHLGLEFQDFKRSRRNDGPLVNLHKVWS